MTLFQAISFFLAPVIWILNRLSFSLNVLSGNPRASLSNVEGLPSEIDGGPLTCQQSVFRHIEAGLRKNPHRLAVLCMHQPASHWSNVIPVDDKIQLPAGRFQPNCVAWTYTQVHEASQKIAGAMVAAGARSNSTILIIIPNGGEYCLLLWTCMLLRLTFSCADPALLNMSALDELEQMIKTVKPSIIVVPDSTGATQIDRALTRVSLPSPLRLTLENPAPGWKALSQLAADVQIGTIEKERLVYDAQHDDPDRVHSIMFTSGTSGQPKGCPQSVRNVTHVLKSQAWLINADNCMLALQQAHNSRGIAPAQTLQTWRAGGAVVMSGQGFSVDDIVSAIMEYCVTFIVLTPAMVHGMAERLVARPIPVQCVHSIQIGGDAVTKDTLIKCSTLFPSAQIYINHGMTEGGGAFTWPFSHTLTRNIPYFGEICPVGAVAPGAIVRIWDTDAGAPALRGYAGELHICCGSIIPGYLDNMCASSFYEDGRGRWFDTGDIAMMNDHGIVYILGRKKDIIKRDGVAIMPAALESCIEQFTGEQSCVVSISHPVRGQEPHAVVHRLHSKKKDEIMNHVLQIFGKDYALKDVASLTEIGFEQFPVNATHKVIKPEVESALRRYLNAIKSEAHDPTS